MAATAAPENKAKRKLENSTTTTTTTTTTGMMMMMTTTMKMAAASSVGGWNGLPKEVQQHCFRFLEYTELARVRRVCRSWNELAPKCALSLVADKRYRISNQVLLTVAIQCPQLRTLSIRDANALTDNALKAVLISCLFLEKLDLRSCNGIKTFGFSKTTENMSDSKTTTAERIGDHKLMYLRDVGVQNCASINHTSVTILCAIAPNLEQFNLNCCTKITDAVLMSLRALTAFQMKGCFRVSTSAVCKLLQQCPRLQLLNLEGCHQLTREVISSLAKHCSDTLQELYLKGCPAMDSVVFAELIHKSLQLQRLDLTSCNVTNELVHIMAECLGESLEEIHLQKCVLVKSSGIEALLRRCSRLQTLDFRGCLAVSNEALVCCELASRLVRLRVCSTIDDQGMENASKCVGLELLDLENCNTITDRGLAFVAHSCGQLRIVNLYGCTSVTSHGVSLLLQSCKQLEALIVKSTPLSFQDLLMLGNVNPRVNIHH